MEKTITYQKLKKETENSIKKAEIYYSLLSALNSLSLTEREIQLIAFSAVKGNLSNANVRDEFCRIYNTSFPTISNIISRLKKLGIVVKEDKKIMLHSILKLDFNKDVILEIRLLNGEKDS
jgi:hypothetical protein